MENKYYKRVKESFDKQNFLGYIGANLENADYGSVIISCNNKPELTQQQGFLHGGLITTLADVSCGYASLTTMPDDCEVLTVEFKINIMNATKTDKLISKGKVIKTGKTLVISEAVVTDSTGEKIIAKMLSTMIVAKK